MKISPGILAVSADFIFGPFFALVFFKKRGGWVWGGVNFCFQDPDPGEVPEPIPATLQHWFVVPVLSISLKYVFAYLINPFFRCPGTGFRI
jgi:hypothetical protein